MHACMHHYNTNFKVKGIHCFGGAEFESGVSWFTGGGNGDIESS